MSPEPKTRIGIALFDGAEELDWAGPWEVFAAWSRLWPDDGVETFTASPTSGPVTCGKGLRVLADHVWSAAPAADLIVYPGGPGAREQVGDPATRTLVQDLRAGTRLMASVCTGALVYADAGLLDGRPATTHWSALDLLRDLGDRIEVHDNDRWVDAGDILTSAGVSAGIDLALHLVARLHSRGRAEEVRHYIQYDPDPFR
jgi:transcriptional regulator GlxA family with amidase domain